VPLLAAAVASAVHGRASRDWKAQLRSCVPKGRGSHFRDTLSRWGSRRLFERLITLGLVRKLMGFRSWDGDRQRCAGAWMAHVEAVIFTSPEPISRGTLARVVGHDCNLDLLIEDTRNELRNQPYQVAGG
jgi:hypothetical protein